MTTTLYEFQRTTRSAYAAVHLTALSAAMATGCTYPMLTYEIDYEAKVHQEATYRKHILPIWARTCRQCHLEGASRGGLSLENESALVNQPSTAPDMNLVTPGLPQDSYLWHKLQGTHREVGGTGDIMPIGPFLDDASMRTVKAWIEGLGAEESGRPPTYDADIAPMLSASCATCHNADSPAPQGGLGLNITHEALLAATSTQLPGMRLVEPGLPGESYLWLKASGEHLEAGGSGDAMPPPNGWDAGSVDILEQWIAEGAPETAADRRRARGVWPAIGMFQTDSGGM